MELRLSEISEMSGQTVNTWKTAKLEKNSDFVAVLAQYTEKLKSPGISDY